MKKENKCRCISLLLCFLHGWIIMPNWFHLQIRVFALVNFWGLISGWSPSVLDDEAQNDEKSRAANSGYHPTHRIGLENKKALLSN